jgi:hypothetical protein
MNRKINLEIGVASILFSIFLFVIAIPYGVTAPSNIKKIVLSPLIWPQILAGILAVVGIALIVNALREPKDDAPAPPLLDGEPGAVLRLCLMAGIMLVYFFLIDVIGMVWSSMLTVLALTALLKTENRIASILTALIVPLLLYAFFAHVAGVAIPQGEFVRLP